MGIFLQLSAQTLTALFAMMQRDQGPQRQYVSVYNVPDADREKEVGNRRMWSDPVKVKHCAKRLDTDTHIFFRESKFQDWSAYGAIQSVGRRETLKGPFINRGSRSATSSSTGKRCAKIRSKRHLISDGSHLFTVPGAVCWRPPPWLWP